MPSSSRHSLLLQHLASSSPHSCPTGRQEEVAVHITYLGPTKNSGVLTGPPGPKKETEKDQGLQTGWVFGGLSLMWCHRCGGSPNVFPRFRELTVVCSLRGLAGIMLPVWGSQACERRGNQA